MYTHPEMMMGIAMFFLFIIFPIITLALAVLREECE